MSGVTLAADGRATVSGVPLFLVVVYLVGGAGVWGLAGSGPGTVADGAALDRPASPDLDLVARCSVSKSEVEVGESVTLDASGSEDAVAYRFDTLGDGTFGQYQESATRTVSYGEPGTYEPRVEVQSSDGATDVASCGTVTVDTNDPPTADFSYTPSDPVPGETVTFDADASDPDGSVVAYEWRVDGSLVGDGPTLEYAFEDVGDHIVTLTVTDDDGATTSVERTVTVEEANDPPAADFTYTPSDPTAEDTVMFEADAVDTDGQVVAYQWRVDGTVVGDGPTLDYSFPEPGDYTVALTVTDDDGATGTVRRTVTVGEANDPPVADVSLSPARPEAGETVTFEADASDPDGSVVAHEWRVDGTVVGDGPTLDYSFPEPGDYIVTLTVTDDDGAAASVERTVTVETRNQPPTARIAGGNRTVTAGEMVTFGATATDDDGSVVDRQWSVDGQRAGTGVEFPYVFEEPGNYTVTLTVTDDDGATDTESVTVTVEENAPPTAEFTYTPLDPVPGMGVTFEATASDPDGRVVAYQWRVDGTVVGDGPALEYVFPGPGDYTVTLDVRDNTDRTTTVEQTVTVEAPNEPPEVALEYTPSNPPPGATVTFEADAADPDGSVVAYEWQVDGTVVGDGPTLEYAFSDVGTHVVALTVTDDDGATATVERTVRVQTDEETTNGATRDSGDETATRATTGEPTTDSADGGAGPGVGVVAALVAVSAVLAVLLRRREP